MKTRSVLFILKSAVPRENGQFLDLPKHLVGPSAASSSDLPRRQLDAPLRITGNSEVMIQDRLLAGEKSAWGKCACRLSIHPVDLREARLWTARTRR